jgi:hypothetical protein
MKISLKRAAMGSFMRLPTFLVKGAILVRNKSKKLLKGLLSKVKKISGT